MLCGLIKHRANICVLHANIKALLMGEIVELVVDVVGVLDVLLQTDDGEALESSWLMNHGVQTV